MKWIVGFLALSLSLAAFAAPVTPAELKKVNAGIAALIAAHQEETGELPDSTLEIISADRDSEKLLNALTAKIGFGATTATVGVSAKNQEIVLTASVSANISEFGLSSADLLAMAPMLQQLIDSVNAEGTYTASMAFKSDNNATIVTVSLVPAKPDPANSVKSLKLTATIPNDTVKNAVTIALSATVNSSSEIVEKAQIALSNIFNSLGNGKEPAEADMTALNEVIEMVLSNVM